MRWILFALAAALACAGLHAQALAQGGFTASVSTRLTQFYEKRFGPPAPRRIEQWKRYASERKSAPIAEAQLLVEVNQLLNHIRFVEDAVHWGQTDYWATPAETVASDGADCEDFSIAKYFLLKELGVSNAKLRITYVKSLKLNQPRMVLAYYAHPDADPLILDNLENTVRSASQRADLVPVYSFNDEEVWIESRGRSGSPRQIRNWSSLLERLEREVRI